MPPFKIRERYCLKKENKEMGTYDYIVKRIDGEYAVLCDEKSGEEIVVALFLLPQETDEGVKLHYESMTYTVV